MDASSLFIALVASAATWFFLSRKHTRYSHETPYRHQPDLKEAPAANVAADNLKKLADGMAGQTTATIQIMGQSVDVPPSAKIFFDYEKERSGSELEITLRW